MLHLTKRAAFALQLAPAAGTIVGNDLLKHGCQCASVDRFPLTDRHCTGGLVVVSARDDPFGIGDDRAVVQEYVDMVRRGQQGANVA